MAKFRKRTSASPADAGERIARADLSSGTADERTASRESVGDTAPGDAERQRIAQRAYELYMARGGGHGRALDDWLAAERELSRARRDDSE